MQMFHYAPSVGPAVNKKMFYQRCCCVQMYAPSAGPVISIIFIRGAVAYRCMHPVQALLSVLFLSEVLLCADVCTQCRPCYQYYFYQRCCCVQMYAPSADPVINIIFIKSAVVYRCMHPVQTLLLIFLSEVLLCADALMKALAGGAQGFAYLSRVLSVLLQTLLQDEIAEVSRWLFLKIMCSWSFKGPAFSKHALRHGFGRRPDLFICTIWAYFEHLSFQPTKI